MEIQLLINEFLKDKAMLRDTENDSLNIVDNQIFSWNFTNIPQPTIEELVSLIPVVEASSNQAAINAEALAYLNSTDYLIIREMDCGTPCLPEIKALRAEARAKIK